MRENLLPPSILSSQHALRNRLSYGGWLRAALLYAKGKIGLNETLINESLLGTIMTARVLRSIKFCGLDAVVPEVSGSAYVCGQATWMIDRRDPLRHGFLLR